MDKIFMKIFLAFARFLDTLHEILLLAAIYVYLVRDIGNPSALDEILS